jgi:hypothetical protein
MRRVLSPLLNYVGKHVDCRKTSLFHSKWRLYPNMSEEKESQLPMDSRVNRAS